MKRDEVPSVVAATRYIERKYGVKGDCPFPDDFDDLAFRHRDNHKWFAILTLVRRSLFFPGQEGELYLLNLKVDEGKALSLYDEGIHPAYHMNKRKWVSVLMDGSVEKSLVERLIDRSYALTERKRKRRKRTKGDF